MYNFEECLQIGNSLRERKALARSTIHSNHEKFPQNFVWKIDGRLSVYVSLQ